jgi:magnesium transporter
MLMIPNLVFSFFGQNVKLPFQDHEAGVLITLVVAVLATVGGVWMVVKRRLF